MVNFKLINWARMNGIDLSRHTDCIDNVRGVCNPRKINCIDVRNCPCKKQRRELAQAAYDRHLSVSPYPQDRGDTWDAATEKAYRMGANEQHDIDLHKACVWLKENRNQLANVDITGFVKLFRQSMKK